MEMRWTWPTWPPSPPGNDEAHRTFKLRVYSTLYIMAAATRESQEMRIKQPHPDTQRMLVWKKPTYGLRIGGNRIRVVQRNTYSDIVSTNERLHVIKLETSEHCRHCGSQTSSHTG